MLKAGSKNLDKMVQMPMQRVTNIWLWLQRQDNRRMNEEHRYIDMATYNQQLLASHNSIDLDRALKASNDDYKAAAKMLGVKSYELLIGWIEWKKLTPALKTKALVDKANWEAKIYRKAKMP
jgi:hypothetical protein